MEGWHSFIEPVEAGLVVSRPGRCRQRYALACPSPGNNTDGKPPAVLDEAAEYGRTRRGPGAVDSLCRI